MIMSLVKYMLNIYDYSTKLFSQIMLNVTTGREQIRVGYIRVFRFSGGKKIIRRKEELEGKKEENGNLEEVVNGLCSFSSMETLSW